MVEGETSYTENAALKAQALAEQLREAGIAGNVLADDSGLEVDALDRRPGVNTAYYGGERSWPQRRELLIAELAALGTPSRRARFVCALHFIAASGATLATFATVEGEIAPEQRGEQGFSFDPVFFYPPLGRTFAELTTEEKSAVSHRAVALAALRGGLRQAGY